MAKDLTIDFQSTKYIDSSITMVMYRKFASAEHSHEKLTSPELQREKWGCGCLKIYKNIDVKFRKKLIWKKKKLYSSMVIIIIV